MSGPTRTVVIIDILLRTQAVCQSEVRERSERKKNCTPALTDREHVNTGKVYRPAANDISDAGGS